MSIFLFTQLLVSKLFYFIKNKNRFSHEIYTLPLRKNSNILLFLHQNEINHHKIVCSHKIITLWALINCKYIDKERHMSQSKHIISIKSFPLFVFFVLVAFSISEANTELCDFLCDRCVYMLLCPCFNSQNKL